MGDTVFQGSKKAFRRTTREGEEARENGERKEEEESQRRERK